MKKTQVDQYNMLLAVENHFDSNASIWTSKIPVSDIKTAFSGVIDQITAAATLQSINSTGATLNKNELRKDLEEKGLFVSSVVSTYAEVNSGQKELYKMAHITKSSFRDFKPAELLFAIENLNAGAMTVIENLEPYGVTQATLTDMMAARDAFFNILNRPVEVTSTRKDATEDIVDLLHQAVSMLEKRMDPIMVVFKTTEPQFYNVYFNDRKINHSGERRLSLVTTTMDANTNTPLADAYIEIVGQHIKRRSSATGQNRVQNLQEGHYTLSVTRIDFAPQSIPFSIVNGETTQLVIEMQKVLTSVPEEEEAE